MLKKLKVWYFIFWILFVISSYYYFFIKTTTSTSTVTTTYETVASGSIKESIHVVGSSELIDEQALRFNKLWTITKVNFKDGDTIKKGQIIAEIDTSVWETSVKEAELNLDNAKLNLTQLYDTINESQLLQSKNTISNTEKNLEISQSELENLQLTQANTLNDISKNIQLATKELENLKITQTNSLKDAIKNIENAKKDLVNAQWSLLLSQSDLEISKTKLASDLENTLSNTSNTLSQIETSFLTEKSNISKIIDEIDIILGYTTKNKYLNDSYEIYLWAKNTSAKNQAEIYLWNSIASYNSLQTLFLEYDNSQDIEKIKWLLQAILDTYTTLEKATDFTYQTLDNSVSSSNFSETTITWMKSSMYGYKTNVQWKLTSVNNSINTLNTLTDTELFSKTNENTLLSKQDSIKINQLSILKKEQEIQTLENNFETTKTNYEIVYKTKETSLQTLQNNYNATKLKNEIDLNTKIQSIENTKKTLVVNRENLKELLQWPTVENVEKAKNNILQSEIKLQDAITALKDYQLESPFDGIVRKIDYKVWDKLLSDSDKYVYIENPSLVQIPVLLDQVDIVKINIWKKATITFDAYPTLRVEWTITSIDYTPVKTSWVVNYTAYLMITDKNFDKKILSWMTADIEIITAEKENILILPSSAITSENDTYYVNISYNWKTIKKEIQTWISSWGKTEIVSWLHIWDRVSIIDISSTTTSKKQTPSLFGNPGSKRTSWGNAGWPPPWF